MNTTHTTETVANILAAARKGSGDFYATRRTTARFCTEALAGALLHRGARGRRRVALRPRQVRARDVHVAHPHPRRGALSPLWLDEPVLGGGVGDGVRSIAAGSHRGDARGARRTGSGAVSAALAHGIASAAAHWHVCVTQAAEIVKDFSHAVASEWRVMVKDPMWAHYGGRDTPEARRAYIGRRFDGYRRNLTQYLHRPECLALAEALEERRVIEVAA